MSDIIYREWPNVLRFECIRYAGHRLSHLRRLRTVDDVTGKKEYIWFRDMSIYRMADVDFILSRYGMPNYGPETWSFYVSGFTFDWYNFIKTYGNPPSFLDRKEHNAWREDVLTKAMDEHILKKDLVFEIDRHDGESLKVAGNSAQWLVDSLNDKGMLTRDTHVLFSGRGGYHVVVPDAEQYFDDFQVTLFKRTAKALSHGAIKVAMGLLDEFHPNEHVRDQGGRGRDYEHFDIHFSPMFPQGVRRCAYALTEYGTISFPVTEKELYEVDDVSYYQPGALLNKYQLKGRGCPAVK